MSCVIKPKNHQLWDEISEYLGRSNRKLIKYWYNVAHDQEFLDIARDELEFNSEGEPTFASLLRAAGTTEYAEKIKQKLGEQLGVGEMTYEEAIERLQSFNRSTPFKQEYMAIVTPSSGNKVTLSLVNKTTNNERNLYKYINQRSLQDRIKFYLNKAGVDYTFLEEGSSENGRYSTENVERTTSGLATLIKVANGENVEASLAEEAGHFAIGALGKSPLVTRLLSLLDTDTMRMVLGEDYETKNLGKNPQKEVAGYLVGQAILNNVDTTSAIGKLASRIVHAAKVIFAKIKGDTVKQAELEARKIANRIAQSFMSETFEGTLENALEQEETFYSKEKSGTEQLFHRFQVKLKESQIQLRTFFPDKAKELGVVLKDMEAGANWGDTFSRTSAMVGLAKAMMSLSDIAVDVQNTFLSIDDDFSDNIKFWDNFYKNSRNLRFCSEFCIAVANILHEFEIYTSKSKALQDTDRLPNDLNVTVNDKDLNLKTLADNLNSLLRGGLIRHDLPGGNTTYVKCDGLFADVQARKADFFVKFCEETYGKNYIIRTKRILANGLKLRKVSTKKYTIRQMIDTLEEDSTLMGRLFGSLGNSNDVISQIVFKAYKTAQKQAHLNIIDAQDKIRSIIKEARSLGVLKGRMYCATVEEELSNSDVENILKNTYGVTENIHFENGRPVIYIQRPDSSQDPVKYVFKPYPKKGALTGDVISLYDNARYEWEYKEFKRYVTTKFKIEHPSLDPNSQRFLIEWGEYFKEKRKQFFFETHHKENNTWVLNDNYISKEYARNFLKISTSRNNWQESAKIADTIEITKENSQQFPEKYILQKWLEIKENLDNRLPEGSTSLHRLPQFRGDTTDITGNLLSMDKNIFAARINAICKNLHDSFSLQAETSEGAYGSDLTYTLEEDQLSPNPLSLFDETLNRIPLYGINRIEDTSRLKTDIFGSLLKYANMACSYESMEYISHALEIGKSVLFEHRKLIGKDGKPIESNKSSKGFRKIYDKIFGTYEEKERKRDRNLISGLTAQDISKATGSNLNVYAKYANFLDKNLYGNHLSGVLFPGLELSKRLLRKYAKGLGILNGIGSLLALAGSPTVVGVSLLDGINEILKESHSGEYFNKKDLAKAHAIFFTYMAPNWLTYFGVKFTSTKFRDDKLSLLIRLLNIDENNNQKFSNWDTKNRLHLKQMFADLCYLPMQATTVYMNVVPYIALMLKKQLISKSGKKRSLWDAYRIDTSMDEFKTRRLALNDIYFTSEDNRELYNYFEQSLEFINATIDQTKDMIDIDAIDFISNLSYTVPDKLVEYFKKEGKEIVDENGKLRLNNRQDLYNWRRTIASQMNRLQYNEQDEAEFMIKARQMVNDMHGIYDSDNKGSIDQSVYGKVWACMKGYMFGMISKAYTNNRYNIYNERETGEVFIDENGEEFPILDGETEGFILTTYKILRLNLGPNGEWRKNFWRTLATGFLATLGTNSKWGTEALKKAGFSTKAFYNLKRAAAGVLATIGMSFLINILKGLGGDDDELEEGNPYTKIKISKLTNKDAREIVKKLADKWDEGIDPGKNYFEVLLRHPEIFEDPEEYKKVQKLSKIYDEGRNRTCYDEEIDWCGLGVYFLSRCQRDNDALNIINSASALVGDKESPLTQEAQGATSLIKSVMSFGMLGRLWEISCLYYGDLKYGDLQDNKLAFLNKIEKYQEYRKETKQKYYSKKELAQKVLEFYKETGTVPNSMFDEDKEFLNYMNEHKEEYASIQELNEQLLNEYYFPNNSTRNKAGDARFATKALSIIPWVKGEYLFYHPEETLDSYMFAVRNQ